jgi:hypothetical protein
LYDNIKPDKFSNTDDVKFFVSEHRNLLQLIPEDNGEYTLETKFYNSPARYFINEDGMFQINKTICKVFDNKIVMASDAYYEELKNSDYDEALLIAENVIKFDIINQKSAESNCGIKTVARNDVGNERIRLTISCGQLDLYNYFGIQDAEGYYEARAYNRILFIWYRCSRRISCNIEQNIGYLDNNNQRVSGNLSFSADLVESYALEEYRSIGSVASKYYNMDVFFNSFDCWAKIPATYNATLKCE